MPNATERRLRDLVRQIMATPPDDKLATSVANEIVDIFRDNGIRDEKEIIEAVHRIIKELDGHMYADTAFLFAVAHKLTQAHLWHNVLEVLRTISPDYSVVT